MYIPLHVHTEYSILDGMSSVSELCRRATELGMPGIAITDHGTMMGVKPFHDYLKRHAPELKPIIGSEIYITDNYDYRIKDSEHRRTFHLILLAKNLQGYRNLCKIASIAATEGKYNKPRVDLSVLREYHEGLICMSACIGGEVPQCILDDDIEGAEAAIMRYKEVFGEDYYLEVCIHPNNREGNPQDVVKDQRIVAESLYQMGVKFGIKVVATNDSHFTYKEQAEAHDVMLAVSCGKLVGDPTRLNYTGEEYLKSEQEMLEVFPDHPEVVRNTMEIFDKVEIYDIDQPVQVPLPDSISSETDCDELLSKHAREGFSRLFDESNEEGRQRLDRELDTIAELGLSRYFLMMEDIVKFAQSEGIEYGPGRGSAAGCLVNYCLGLTKINPLQYRLYFERFINPERCVSFPGIDIDFESGGISRIWKHLCDTYGKENVAGQVTIEEPILNQVFQRVAKALEISPKRYLPFLDLLGAVECDSEKGMRKINEFISSDGLLKKAYEISKELRGRKTGTGVHACAFFVSPNRISDTVPVMKDESYFVNAEIPIVQYEKYHAEDAGLVKINILEFKTLNVIKNTLNEINTDSTDKIDVLNLSDDWDTNMMMYMGDKNGVFMFESEGLKTYLRQMKSCPQFNDLVALNTMYRPGLLDEIPDYLKGINGNTKRTGIPELDKILEETHGVLIYQEQYIRFFESFLGKTPAASVGEFKDLMRKKEDRFPEYKKELMSEGTKRHLSERDVERAWNMLVEHSKYAFLKSHSICYTTIAYQCAYLKAHFPKVFVKQNELVFGD